MVIDLRDAYFHLFMHKHSRKWLRFTWNSKAFQFRVLPFGLSLAPWLFTPVIREVVIVARQRAIRLHVFLDDWLVLAPSLTLSKEHTTSLTTLARSLGFVLHPDKCSLTPSQTFTYLGMVFNTVDWTVRPTDDRLTRFTSLRDSLLLQQFASARQLAMLMGQMESLAPLLPLGNLHKRPFQRSFRTHWNQATEGWDKLVPTSSWLRLSLEQWLNEAWLLQGVPISRQEPQEELYTDASCRGWGAHCGDHAVSET